MTKHLPSFERKNTFEKAETLEQTLDVVALRTNP